MGCLASVLCCRCSEVKGEGYAPGICHRPDLSGVKSEIQLHVSGDPAKTSLETSLEVEKSIGADLLLMSTHGFTALFHCLVRNPKHSPQCLFCMVFGLNICASCPSTEISRVPPLRILALAAAEYFLLPLCRRPPSSCCRTVQGRGETLEPLTPHDRTNNGYHRPRCSPANDQYEQRRDHQKAASNYRGQRRDARFPDCVLLDCR